MFKQLGASAIFKLEDELAIPSVAMFAPLAIAPVATPFGQRRKPSFPLLGKRPPVEQQGIVPDYEETPSGDDDYEQVTIEDLPTDLESLLGNTGKSGKLGDYQIGPKGTKATFGVTQAFDPGKAIGQVASMSGSFITAGAAGQKNLEQLQYAQAMAGLGVKGYGVGVVNNQVVGVTPNNVIGTLPNASPKDMQKIRDTLTGKSGPMKAGIETFKSLTPQTPVTSGMRQFQKEIIESKLSDSLKAEILGLGTALNVDFGVDTFKGKLSPQKLTDPKTFIQQYKEATNLGTGDERDDQIDEDTFSDFTAPSLETTTEADFFSSMPSGGFFSDSDDSYDSGTGDPSGGFGGSSEGDYGFTAYGGRIGMYNGGFTSNTKTIKGVGLIKPEQTFMDTDVVDDDIELTAENGDFIVNGPASKQREKEIKLLVDYGIDELRKEGVDIRVGNPKIKGKDRVPLIVASSETYIPRVIAEKIGYPILDALNNTGKPEVAKLKRKLDNEPTDKGKYQASEGMLVKNPQQGFLFRRPDLNVTGPNIDKFEERFVPGISDNPPAMTLNQQTFFDDYEFGDIKKAIKKTEIQGFEEYPYIFTGVKAKKGKSSSAFGPMQITKALIEDFEKRSPDYKTLSKEEKNYLKALKIQGEDKINQELYGTVFRGPEELRKKVDARKVYGKKAKGLKPYGKGTIDPKLHEKYYDRIADIILLHKLRDHDNIEDFLASYGEGANYADKVLNDLRDIMQGVEPPTAVKSQ
tara:strand:- start:72 stop:2312 length:2241 start_codon:yes stop_codon:yes gene_type:complete